MNGPAPPQRARGSPGTCYGFQVASTLPFAYLRDGTGIPLEVTCDAPPAFGPAARLLREWPARPGRTLLARLYQEGGRYFFWIETEEVFVVDPAVPRIVVPEADPIRREDILWGTPASLCLLHQGHLPLHAAAVEVDGGAILLAAPGGFGKTTLAAAFYAAGYRVLSEDVTCITTQAPPSVIPGPASLRLRPDVIDYLHLPRAEVVRRSDVRVSLALDPSSRGRCDPVPLRAVAFLRVAPEIAMTRVKATDAIADLWVLSQSHPDDAALARCFAHVVDLARDVPVWNVYRPLRFDALADTVGTILSTCLADA
ncbi:MAG: hypothetical protein QN203_12535 [Armatimonadota bacterium]|nr:hypothetical protein [Armatimonadota bacterium]MDR7531977.1 hypothetical protein [Armatimonadota bacterium]